MNSSTGKLSRRSSDSYHHKPVTKTTTTTTTTITSSSSSSYHHLRLPHHEDFTTDFMEIDSVEWGPRPDEEGYDTDQELASRPKPSRASDPCHCQPTQLVQQQSPEASLQPSSSSLPPSLCCLDSSCLLWACYEECRSNCPAKQQCGGGNGGCNDDDGNGNDDDGCNDASGDCCCTNCVG